MSTPEYQPGDQRSSVQISENSKGEPAVTVKAYTHDLDTLDDARAKALAVYSATVAALRGPS